MLQWITYSSWSSILFSQLRWALRKPPHHPIKSRHFNCEVTSYVWLSSVSIINSCGGTGFRIQYSATRTARDRGLTLIDLSSCTKWFSSLMEETDWQDGRVSSHTDLSALLCTAWLHFYLLAEGFQDQSVPSWVNARCQSSISRKFWNKLQFYPFRNGKTFLIALGLIVELRNSINEMLKNHQGAQSYDINNYTDNHTAWNWATLIVVVQCSNQFYQLFPTLPWR